MAGSFPLSVGVSGDLPAHAIFILIQRPLIGASEMAVIEARIETLIGAQHMILAMQPRSLMGGDLAAGKVAIDAPVLMGEPMIDLDAVRMLLRPGGGGGAGDAGKAKRGGQCQDESGTADDGHDLLHC